MGPSSWICFYVLCRAVTSPGHDRVTLHIKYSAGPSGTVSLVISAGALGLYFMSCVSMSVILGF